MGILGGLFDAATKVVGGLVGGNSPIGGIIDKAGDLLGGITGDKIGDKIGDVVGDLVKNDGFGDKIGDVLGSALGGDSSIAGGLLDKVGDVAGSLAGPLGGLLGHAQGEGSPLAAVSNLVGGENGLLGSIVDKAGDVLGGAAASAEGLFGAAGLGVSEAPALTLPSAMPEFVGAAAPDLADLSQLLADVAKPTAEPSSLTPSMQDGAMMDEFYGEMPGPGEMDGGMSIVPVDLPYAEDNGLATGTEEAAMAMSPEMMQMQM